MTSTTRSTDASPAGASLESSSAPPPARIDDSEPNLGPIGRLGAWTVDHRRIVFAVWALVVLVLGVLAPRVEHALSGAGWESTGSESVAVRKTIDREFGGQSSSALMVVVHARRGGVTAGPAQRKIERAATLLRKHDAVSRVVLPDARAGTISRSGDTAVILAGAARQPDEMVRAADELKDRLAELDGDGVTVSLTGASGMWSDFNEANRAAMMKSELMSWPVTMAILVIAFGSLAAAGLPLVLTIAGLVSSAGMLYLGAQVWDISIWAMNFALMFALALGIDYALFIVARYRAALFGEGLSPRNAVAVAMDTAGKAVLFSGITVLISLTAVMLVPSPAFRSMAAGIIVSVVFVLAASLTLLPAILSRFGRGINRLSLPWVHEGEHRSRRFERLGTAVWKRPAVVATLAIVALVVVAIPVLRIDTGMPSIAVVPTGDSSRVGYQQVQRSFGVGAPGALHVLADVDDVARVTTILERDRGIAAVMPPQSGRKSDLSMIVAIPRMDPSSSALGATVERLRDDLPSSAQVGGAAVENHDLEQSLSSTTWKVVAIVLLLGFFLLLIVVQAPVIAAIGVASNLLATAAAFGVGVLVFQDGHFEGVLGFESQGFLNAWGPVFFFAMIFAISMDYTVFLLSSAKEHWDKSGDAREAVVGGVAHSGRVILAAAAVMVAVFFTFAISGPLPPKEMGIILGMAVLLDAVLVRLLLVPALLALAGQRAWASPVWLRRILPKVTFGH